MPGQCTGHAGRPVDLSGGGAAKGKSGTSEEAIMSGLRPEAQDGTGQVKGRKGKRKPSSFQGLKNHSACGDGWGGGFGKEESSRMGQEKVQSTSTPGRRVGLLF